MIIQLLQTAGIFACHCKMGKSEIEVGMLFLRSDEPGRIVSLLDNKTQTRYTVYIEGVAGLSLDVKLKVIDV